MDVTHAVLRHPRPFDGLPDGLSACVLLNTDMPNLFGVAVGREQGQARPNVILMATTKEISEAAIEDIPGEEIAAEADAGAVLLVGSSIARQVRERR